MMHTNMNPQAFIAKWSSASLKERAAAQEHFIDLCRMLGEKRPVEADPAEVDDGTILTRLLALNGERSGK